MRLTIAACTQLFLRNAADNCRMYSTISQKSGWQLLDIVYIALKPEKLRITEDRQKCV